VVVAAVKSINNHHTGACVCASSTADRYRTQVVVRSKENKTISNNQPKKDTHNKIQKRAPCSFIHDHFTIITLVFASVNVCIHFLLLSKLLHENGLMLFDRSSMRMHAHVVRHKDRIVSSYAHIHMHAHVRYLWYCK
jgi:hypothetical protein